MKKIETNNTSVTLALEIGDISDYGLFHEKTLIAVIDKNEYLSLKSILASLKAGGLDTGTKPWNGKLYLLDVDYKKFIKEIKDWTTPEDAIEKYGDLANKDGVINPTVLAVGGSLYFRYSFKNVSGHADTEEFFINTLDALSKENAKDDVDLYEIRYLKSGLIKVPADKLPENFNEMDRNQKLLWATEYLNELDDHTIIEGMRDIEGGDSMFDEITAEAVQKESWIDTNKEYQCASALWNVYADPDASLSLYEWENRNMGNFLIQNLGFNLEQVSNIANLSVVSDADMLKNLEHAFNCALNKFRAQHGEMLLEQIKNDNVAPAALKELIEKLNITRVVFEKIVNSEDYMPDHCVFLNLIGDETFIVETEDKSETWEEVNYEAGIYHVIEKSNFSTLINDEEILDRQITDEEGESIYDYLLKIPEDIDQALFRNYLLERN